ncbi:hypothetical protein AMAG_00450 [Allomyces macrogynus ATCC 38327]|uniref:Ras-GAP domain-containing protein n=1 Tax=Allomyces macrogynus (strain ATCC 38327) TaxID=578462 RepID=A0A0L0RW06_ALLM3|nr:hypothetical protein AMAG_00450 [Allomyces macrogynus ATCC 38327]|eukprot:KNE54478.1 hypothetical protein AMAG_00450 [Allomyces macrogynus ATCC 38327]
MVFKLQAASKQTDNARHYLDSIVANRVAVLAQIPDLDVEVDPTPTDAPPAVCAARLCLLQDLAAALFTAILASLDRVPLGIRRICAQIQCQALRKDPCVPRARGRCDWRFFPAAVLQHLANQPSRTKEPYMAALHAWSEAHADTMQRFLLAVANDSVSDDVDDLYVRGAPAVLAAHYPIPLNPMAALPFLPAELAAADPKKAAAAVAAAAVVAELEQAVVRVPPSMRGVLRHVPPASAAWLDAVLHSAGAPVQHQVRELFAAGNMIPARLAHRVAVAVAYARQRDAEQNTGC